MSVTYNYSNSILIPNSTNFRQSDSEVIPYHFYNQILVRAGYTDVEVEIFYGAALTDVVTFGIISNNYTGITYKVGLLANPAVTLDNAQFWRGRGMLDYLPAAPDTLYFSNAGVEDANVQVIVGLESYTP